MVEAGGVGIFKGIDNTQLIEIAKRPKRWNPQNSPQLERNWNAEFFTFCLCFHYPEVMHNAGWRPNTVVRTDARRIQIGADSSSEHTAPNRMTGSSELSLIRHT